MRPMSANDTPLTDANRTTLFFDSRSKRICKFHFCYSLAVAFSYPANKKEAPG